MRPFCLPTGALGCAPALFSNQMGSATLILEEGIATLKYYIKISDLLERLRRDKDGVASFEYIIVSVLYHHHSGRRVQ